MDVVIVWGVIPARLNVLKIVMEYLMVPLSGMTAVSALAVIQNM